MRSRLVAPGVPNGRPATIAIASAVLPKPSCLAVEQASSLLAHVQHGRAQHRVDAPHQGQAARLGIDLRQPRAVIVLELAEDMRRPNLALSRLQRVQAELATHWPALLMAVISPREIERPIVQLTVGEHRDTGPCRLCPVTVRSPPDRDHDKVIH